MNCMKGAISRKPKSWQITVRGGRRENVDVDMLVQAVMALGEQMHAEQRLVEMLKGRDERVVETTVEGWPALRLGGHLFMVRQDGATTAYRLPEPLATQVLSWPMAHKWRPGRRADFMPGWVVPYEPSRDDSERLAVAAMEYAAQDTEPALTIRTLWAWPVHFDRKQLAKVVKWLNQTDGNTDGSRA